MPRGRLGGHFAEFASPLLNFREDGRHQSAPPTRAPHLPAPVSAHVSANANANANACTVSANVSANLSAVVTAGTGRTTAIAVALRLQAGSRSPADERLAAAFTHMVGASVAPPNRRVRDA